MRDLPRILWRALRVPPRILYAAGLGPLVGRLVLLLTTTGRRTGRPRVTPLQYQEDAGVFYVAAARGSRADWLRNIAIDPRVEVRVRSRRFRARASVVSDSGRVADFLAMRLRRHPRMMPLLLRLEGVPPRPDRRALEALAPRIALVALTPAGDASAQGPR